MQLISLDDLRTPQFYIYLANKKCVRGDKLNLTIKDKDVVAIKRGSGNKPLKIKLPILASKELALLISKTMGDGCIAKDFRFIYYNNEKVLIREAINAINKAIGKSNFKIYKGKNNVFAAKFPSVVGILLHMMGAPKGYKISQNICIPNWILSTAEFKKMFIRGLFDDEGCAYYDVSHRSRKIIMAQGKQNTRINELKEFFETLRNILLEFGIKTGSVNVQTYYGEHVILRFLIQNKQSLENFRKEIGFSHPKKRKILDGMLNSYLDLHKNKNAVLNFVINSRNAVTIKEVANYCGINSKLASAHLFDLVKSGVLAKTYCATPAKFAKLGAVLKNSKDLILEILNEQFESTVKLAKSANVNYKYAHQILTGLEKEGKVVSCAGKYPEKMWKLKR
jgi:predicted transcriptional regulator